jgi:hypothetical protein
MPTDVRKAFDLPARLFPSILGYAQFCWGEAPNSLSAVTGSAEHFRTSGGRVAGANHFLGKVMLKQISISILLLLLLTSTLPGAQHGDWVKVAPPGAGFSVMMPSKPNESMETKEDYTLHSYGAVMADTIFIVVYGDYAPSMKMNEAAELIANRDNFLKGVNAQLISSKEIKLSGRSGLEFTGEDDRRLYKSRVYIFGNRVHQIASATLKGDEDTESVDRFFASFAFTAVTDPHGKP